MMYKACKYCIHAHCNACKEWLSEDDPLHEKPNFGCQAKERNVISEYISEAKEYVDDAIVKNVFLNCWKKLELGFVNVDHLLNQIHMLYDEENGTSIIELVLKSMGNIKQDPEAIVRCNLTRHRSVTPFIIQQPIRRPHLLERVYKPMRTPH